MSLIWNMCKSLSVSFLNAMKKHMITRKSDMVVWEVQGSYSRALGCFQKCIETGGLREEASHISLRQVVRHGKNGVMRSRSISSPRIHAAFAWDGCFYDNSY